MKTYIKTLLLLPTLIAGLSLVPAGRVTAQTFTTLHNFTDYISGSDGRQPDAGLIVSGNTLYGTTEQGGNSGVGTVFKVNIDGTAFTNLYSFSGSDGTGPIAGLILSGNTLYGTAYGGGSSGNGTVFKLNTDGTGFMNLHSFTAAGYSSGTYTNSDGVEPYAGLILSGNTLYGTTADGGSSGGGTVFRLNTDGTGFTNLRSFNFFSDGAYLEGGLILSGNTLYGTAYGGGSSGNGTVFAVKTDGTGFTNLHSFTGGSDGASPYAGLILSGNTLYGTASTGGSSGKGTVFSLSLAPQLTIHYVNVNNASPASPYTDWATAATTIQAAVDAAVAGDQILVTNGVYQTGGTTGNRVAVNKPVTVQSVNGAAVTVIHGQGTVRCVYLSDGAALVGFTLTGGAVGDDAGGGVRCDSIPVVSTSAVVSNCVLTGNSAGWLGGGAYGCTLNNCSLNGNSADDAGGAYLSALNNCTLTANSAFSEGGGVASCTLNNCTLSGNSANEGGGADNSTLNNCIVYYNSAPNGDNYYYCRVSYSCTTPLPTNGIGNITSAPLFVNQAGGNLRLQANSPCINAGSNPSAPAGPDLDGRPRILGGTVDIGAYEFQPGVSGLFLGWLQQYGLPTDGTADSADPDGDHMTNWQEWRTGTNPKNALSVLRLLTPSRVGPDLVVRWESVSGQSYFVEWRTNLAASSPFLLLASNLTGQSGMTTYTHTNAAGAGPVFYRVGVP